MPISTPHPVRRRLSSLALVALLLGLPLACDDDGTSPPDPDHDELPDTIPTGTYEVGDLHVPEGDTFTVEGAVVVLASGSIRVDGALMILPGASLALVAADSLILAGTIGSDPVSSDSVPHGPTPAAGASPADGAGDFIGVGRVVRLDEDVYGVPVFVSTIENGTVEVGGSITAKGGDRPQGRGDGGGPGHDLHIGTPEAIERAESLEDNVGRPAHIVVKQGAVLRAGSGAPGMTDVEGVLVERTLFGLGGAGGDGGNVVLSADEVTIDGEVRAGFGGNGGSCGWQSLRLSGADGTVQGEAGVSIHCTTGAAGNGGSVIIAASLVNGGENIEGGLPGKVGYFLGRAGNGGPAGPGGSVQVFYGLPGQPGDPAPDGAVDLPFAVVFSGGNGGDSEGPDAAGGPGGSISLLTIDNTAAALSSSGLQRPIANGGAGWSGCLTQPFTPGSPGGLAGSLILAGGTMPTLAGEGDAFAGGAGSDGSGPGAGGSGGFDDAGNRLGPDGSAGTACNQTPSVTSVDPSETTIGDSPTTIALTGEDFAPGNCTVHVNGAAVETDCTSATAATVILPVANQVAGNAQFCMANGPPGGGLGTECADATILNRPPVLSGLSQTEALAGEAVDLVVTGNYIVPGTVVHLDDAPQPTTVNGPTQAVAHIAATAVPSAGERDVSLVTADGVHSTGSLPLSINNPAPQIGTLTPTYTVMGSDAFFLAITGTGFVNGTIVRWESSDLTASVVSATQLLVQISADKVAAAGTYSVAVITGGPGGGASVRPFEVRDPTPGLSALVGSSVQAGSPDFTIELTTSNLGEQFRVWWQRSGGSAEQLVITSLDPLSSQVTVQVPAYLVDEPGEAFVSIETIRYADIGGSWTSSELPFTITAGIPSVTSANPSTFPVGDDPTTIDLTGTAFSPDCTAYMNGQPLETECSSATTASVIVPVAQQVAGDAEFCMENAPPGGGLGAECAHATILNRAPVVASLSETAIEAGVATDLVVTGNFIVPGTVVHLDDDAQPTTVNSATEAVAHIAASEVASLGERQVSLVTPDGVHSTSSIPLLVEPGVPVITSLDPGSLPVGSGDSELLVNGSRFLDGQSVVLLDATPLVTTWVSGSRLSAEVPAAEASSAAEREITVVTEGAGASSPIALTFTNPQPNLGALSPSTAEAGDPAFTMVLAVDLVGAPAHALFNGVQLPATGIGPSGLSVEVPAALIAEPGTYDVYLVYAAPGGGTSGPLPFTVTLGVPSITSLDPSSLPVGSGDSELLVNGSRFVDGQSVVLLDATPLVTTWVSGSQLSAEVPAAEASSAAEREITVENEGAGASGPLVITFTNPQPNLGALSPSTAEAGDPAFTMVLAVDIIGAPAHALFNGVQLPATVLGPSGLSVEVPAALIAEPGTYDVYLVYAAPGGGTSGPLPFTVTPADDACETVTTIGYGETVNGTLGEDGCKLNFGSNWDYVDNLAVTTTEQVSTVTLTANPSAYVQVRQPGVGGAYVFSGSSPLMVFAPDNSPFEAVVSRGSGTPSEGTYSFTFGPAASVDIAGCPSNTPMGFAPFDLTSQTIAGTDCSRFTPAATLRADEIALRWPVGQVVRVTMQSSDFVPTAHIRCSGSSGACPQAHYPGIAGPGTSVVELTNPSANAQYFLYLGAPTGSTGAYTATVELNPVPAAACAPNAMGADSLVSRQLSSADCPGALANQVYERLQRVAQNLGEGLHYERYTASASSSIAVRVGDDFGFPRASFGALGSASIDYVSADYDYALFPTRVLSTPDQVVNYSITAHQLAAAEWSNSDCRQVFVAPNLTLTQQLAVNDCSRAGGKREERYWVIIQAGQQIRAEVLSTAFDAFIEVWTTTSSTPVATDDNSAGGTNARVNYTSPTTQIICVTVSGVDTNLGEHTTTILFP